MASSPSAVGAPKDGLPALVARFAQALENFQRSDATFRILSTRNRDPAKARAGSPKTLLVLDSSFNPPTLAHKRMALSALFEDSDARGVENSGQSRILLLLAINNADKAPKPAAFPQRLAMMHIFGDELLADVAAADPRGERYRCDGVDVGVTTEPYFHAKAAAVAAASSADGYHRPDQQPPEQVYLTGFDTLIRIFDPKYYSSPTSADGDNSSSMAAVLGPFFARARLRVTTRPDADWGSVADQAAYLEGLRQGGLERVGGRAEWARDRIDMVGGGGSKQEEAVVSSTKVREAVLRENWDALKTLVSGDVADWIREQGLYAGASA
ncbi:Nucleotidylyl transferase [Hypoxylon sp. FL1284]|nr:Nucleotidylyl transferase [Hypoxylon sp. FL1284]